MKNRNLIFIIAVFVLVSCTNANFQNNKDASYTNENAASLKQNAVYKNITVDELNKQLKNKDFVLVDVHIPEQKHINGTDAFIPYDEIEKQLDKLPSDKDAKIILYCRTGRMSEIAAEKLAKVGYTNVYNVVGGIMEWVKKGYKYD